MLERGRGGAFGLRLIACCLAMFALASQPSHAADEVTDAEQVVRGLASDIWSSLDQPAADDRRQQLAQAIRARTDTDILSRLALGKHWRGLDEDQQSDYQRLFSTVIIDTLASRLDVFIGKLTGPLEQHFKISDSTVAGKRDVLVRSKVMPPDIPAITVDWRLRRIETGPVIIDMVIEGVSLLVSQRAEFAAVIERSRIEGLLTELRRHTQPNS